jgi:hypothetical protein
VLSGHCTCNTRQLWHFSMPLNLPSPKKMSPTEHDSNWISNASTTCCICTCYTVLFSPIYARISTQQRLLDQFPGINSKNIAQTSTTIISYGQRTLGSDTKNQASTKQKPESANIKDDGDDDMFPTSTSSGERSHHCYATIMEPTKGQIYTDQTGLFVQASSTGNNYLLILYDSDSNSILAEPLKTQTGQAILAAYKIIHTRLCNAGLCPKLQCLDNECSEALKQFMSNEGVDYQLVLPGNTSLQCSRAGKLHIQEPLHCRPVQH